MHRLYDNLLIFTVLAGVPGGLVFAAGEQARQTASMQQPAYSTPREFCRSRGGSVSETQNSHIYLCCYKSKSKCVVTDTQQTVSWPIPYRHRHTQAQQPLRVK